VQRQRVVENLLGGRNFCPVIRRTEKCTTMERIDPRKRCEEVVATYPQELLRRALSYLYNKETKSSFEIEHIKPSSSRTKKFIGLLEMAEHKDFCDKPLLIDVQNRIVDPRFRETNYRSTQNYVGQTISCQKQLVHYVCPKPDAPPELMDGLLTAHQVMKEGAVPAIVHAAAMLKNPALYDHSLKAFSSPLMRLVEYDLDDLGQMTVPGETGRLYRYIDMTAQAEALYDFVKLTIEHELVEELDFLANYDRTKQAIQEIVDMPDRLIDLFIQLCLQNNGRLSAKKRESHFGFLTDDELASMENAVQEGCAKD